MGSMHTQQKRSLGALRLGKRLQQDTTPHSGSNVDQLGSQRSETSHREPDYPQQQSAIYHLLLRLRSLMAHELNISSIHVERDQQATSKAVRNKHI